MSQESRTVTGQRRSNCSAYVRTSPSEPSGPGGRLFDQGADFERRLALRASWHGSTTPSRSVEGFAISGRERSPWPRCNPARQCWMWVAGRAHFCWTWPARLEQRVASQELTHVKSNSLLLLSKYT